MKNRWIWTGLSILGTTLLAACGNDSDTTAEPALPESLNCHYGAAAASRTAAVTPNLGAILSECEFNRLYRGNSPNNQYDPYLYSENPGTAKSAKSFAYYSYANLVAAYNDLFSASKWLAYAPFSSGDYTQPRYKFRFFLAGLIELTLSSTPDRGNHHDPAGIHGRGTAPTPL